MTFQRWYEDHELDAAMRDLVERLQSGSSVYQHTPENMQYGPAIWVDGVWDAFEEGYIPKIINPYTRQTTFLPEPCATKDAAIKFARYFLEELRILDNPHD